MDGFTSASTMQSPVTICGPNESDSTNMNPITPISLGGKRIWPPFTIPSGIITVHPSIIARVAREIPVGLITTKSIGVHPYGGYAEPVFSEFAEDGSLSTAIGLSTPGYRAWVEEMKAVYPFEKAFLLTSIFGRTPEEFMEVAIGVAPFTDGLELNFCCPHSLEFGEAVARQGDLTVEITRQVRRAVDKPIVVKLTPNVGDIGGWARALVRAGADAIAAIGPTTAVTVTDPHTRKPVLSFGSGGLSGSAIVQRGLDCVRAIRAAVPVPIIAGGGIRGANDVRAYHAAGGNVFSVGTNLATMDTPALSRYFAQLYRETVHDERDDESAVLTYGERRLRHKACKVITTEHHDAFTILRFDKSLDAQPGQFVFAWLPDVGEKPFSVADSDPLTLAVRSVGKVSAALCALRTGDEVMIRGPFGKRFPVRRNPVLVAGGCGAVPLRFLAGRLERPLIILGAANSESLLFRETFQTFGETIIATDDGSAGIHGTAVDALKSIVANRPLQGSTFYNCGPELMMLAAAEQEIALTSRDSIFLCVERHTCCGVGLCGKCSLDGYRTCVDGPCLSLDQLDHETEFGRWRRSATGGRESIHVMEFCDRAPQGGRLP